MMLLITDSIEYIIVDYRIGYYTITAYRMLYHIILWFAGLPDRACVLDAPGVEKGAGLGCGALQLVLN